METGMGNKIKVIFYDDKYFFEIQKPRNSY